MIINFDGKLQNLKNKILSTMMADTGLTDNLRLRLSHRASIGNTDI